MAGASLPREAALQRAAALFTAGRLEEARSGALELLASDPANFLVLHLLGAIAVKSRKPDEALDYETRALALRPDDAEALCNRGIALRALGRVEEALADYERVLAARPGFVPALNLKGVALAARNRNAEAIESYDRAISLDPNYAAAHFNLSFSELALGNFERGWREFEWRWRGSDTQIARRDFGKPQWTREDPAGKTILVHAEQGLGDAIQFCRYVPLLAQCGAKVILEVQAPLEGLMSQLPAQVVRMGDALPGFDLHCPIMSLPLAFGTRLESIPATVPYLRAPRDHVERWSQQLGPREKPRIGLAWSGNATLSNDRNRSMPLASLAPLRDGKWSLVGVQKDVRESDRDALADGAPIQSFGDELTDLRDAAALMELVDVVVSVDTAAAHLAGAMGRPTWILLPFAPDWRWHPDREHSAWYPGTRLFRQERPGEWGPVVERVKQELLSSLKRKNR